MYILSTCIVIALIYNYYFGNKIVESSPNTGNGVRFEHKKQCLNKVGLKFNFSWYKVIKMLFKCKKKCAQFNASLCSMNDKIAKYLER